MGRKTENMKPKQSGSVYILTNPAMPGLVKIGCTGRSAATRARELSQPTGVPAAYVVAWEWPVSDWQAVEAITHNKLGVCRPNLNREHFTCSVRKARRAIRRAARAYLRPWWLRLLIGPRRERAGGLRFAKRPARSGDMLLAVATGAVMFAFVIVAHPAPVSWLPASVQATIGIIEQIPALLKR